MTGPWVSDDNAALLTDLYELTMLQSYLDCGMKETAVFDLFVRRLPPSRNYLVACGLEEVLRYLETLHFSETSLNYLRSLGTFNEGFLDHLRGFRFSGDVYAVAEGTVVFANEPMVEIVAPLPEAQLVETFVMNQIHLQTLAASKAARIVAAAKGRTIVDFGLRRIHGSDAGVKTARAFCIAGVEATSNVAAGQIYGLPVAGTMAHSYIQAHADELGAFRQFVKTFPSTILLVDTYDTLGGIRHVIELARELGDSFRVHGVRLDSGDLDQLSKQARALLDAAGLQRVAIFASSSLDEYSIRQLVASGAPIAGFGVGVRMGVSSDAPYLDIVYKLVEYAGQPRMKLSEDKSTLPGRKQVFRQDGRDVIALHDEQIDGEPLLFKVMENGRRTEAGVDTIQAAKQRFQTSRQNLPAHLWQIDPVDPAYPVEVSPGVRALGEHLSRRF